MSEYKNQKWSDEYITYLFELTNVKLKKDRVKMFKEKFPESDFTEHAIATKMSEVGASRKRCSSWKTKPLYSEQEKKHYIQIKVAQPNVWWQKQKWVYLETHPWEVTNINETDVFIFLDGDNRNFAPNNIERLERKLQPAFIHCGGVVKGNATLSRINLATTVYVAGDETADLFGILKQIDDNITVNVVDPKFEESEHGGLKNYLKGFVKEGAGAGGAMYTALALGNSVEKLRNKIEKVCK